MFSVQAESSAPPEKVWPLLAEPTRWPEWAAQITGANGLGSPEVEAGRRGVVVMVGFAAVPVRITAKEPGRSWDWRAGPARFRHIVEPTPTGALVRVEFLGPAPIAILLWPTYRHVMRRAVRRLAEVAAQ